MSEADYKPTLIKLMSFLDRVVYPREQIFTPEQIGAITCASLMRYFNTKTFGVPEPPVGHQIQPLVRSSTLEYWKKAVSFFHPNRLMGWNDLTGVGNPTKSRQLNDLIKLVKKKEVRGQGVPSQARRPIRANEYCRVIRILKDESDEGNIFWKYGIPALMNFQFHLLTRIDCATQALVANLKPHPSVPSFLKMRLAWSKNVMEERDAPWQHVLASMDPIYCNYISLALWLELYMESSPTGPLTPYLFAFSNDTVVPDGGDKAKDSVQGVYL